MWVLSPAYWLAVEAGVTTAAMVLTGVVVTAIGGWFVARRSTSGSISTSAAADLWAESQAMRRELREEVVGLRAENRDLRDRVTALEAKVRELRGG